MPGNECVKFVDNLVLMGYDMKDTLHILTRVSTTIQEEEGTSLKTQREIGVNLADKMGMDYQVHNEGGTSSAKDSLDNRPVMMNLLRLMDQGVVKNLYVWNTDRLSRNPVTWYLIRQKMVKNGVVLYTNNGIHDTTDFMENMVLGILSEVAQYDNLVRTERSRLGKIEKVKLNYWRGGDCPYGFMLQWDGAGNRLVENPEESKWVKYIYSEYAKGTTLNNIKRELERNGVKTRRDNDKWSMGSLQVMLRNDTYLGFDRFADKKSKLMITNTIPQLISNILWEDVQERKRLLLIRKGQLNKTKKFYLFRDFLYCSCGTPIGGRIRPDKCIRNYYCPLAERKFNNTYLAEKKCTMKKCLNIPNTDQVLWDKIIDVLSDTISIKENLLEKTPVGQNLSSHRYRIFNKELDVKIAELTKTKNAIEKGLVDVETEKLLGKYPSAEVYKGIKSDLMKKHHQVSTELEHFRNSLKIAEQASLWTDWVEKLGRVMGRHRDVPEKMKKELLRIVLKKIVVDYAEVEKVHKLTIHFKIPVYIEGMNGAEKSNENGSEKSPKKGRKTLDERGDQPFPFENYSTVTDFARFLGMSTLHLRMTAMWYESSWSGTVASMGISISSVSGISM